MSAPDPPELADPPDPDDDVVISARNSRYGLVLFFVYLALYGGFMGLNTFAPQWMGRAPFGGVNLALIYGMTLIAGALVLALLYAWLCRRPPAPRSGP